MAQCAYFGQKANEKRRMGCRVCEPGQPCKCERPSDATLAFFSARPEQSHDRFYCGCGGWD